MTIEDRYSSRRPSSDEEGVRLARIYEVVKQAFIDLETALKVVPPGHHKDIAIVHLETAAMFMTKAVSRGNPIAGLDEKLKAFKAKIDSEDKSQD